jgi:hypothetical protein
MNELNYELKKLCLKDPPNSTFIAE